MKVTTFAKITEPNQALVSLPLVFATLLSSNMAIADSVVAKLFFEKSPPRAGVLYAADGQKNPIKKEVVDQTDKQFDDDIYVMSPGSEIIFKNSDTMDHNIFARGNENAPAFDVGLISPQSEKTMPVEWGTSSFERLGCKIHPKMRAYMASVPNDNYLAMPFKQAGLNESYTLEIDDSTTKIGLLLSGYDPLEVAVAKGETVEVEIKKRDDVRGKLVITRSE